MFNSSFLNAAGIIANGVSDMSTEKNKKTENRTIIVDKSSDSSYLEKIKNKKFKLEEMKRKKKNIGFYEYKGKTDGYWKDLETKETKVMILSIPKGTFITTPDNPKKEYSSDEINGNFLIFDGLLYKSNIDTKSIVYMEV